MNNTTTLQSILNDAQENLSAFASARLDAELLLCEVMQCQRSRLYVDAQATLPVNITDRFNELVAQRKSGLPVAYLTGRREFWSMELAVNRHTLVPRPETECLVEQVLTLLPADACMPIADIGTGSGAIALALASERPGCRITATDVCPDALAIAEQNAQRLELANIDFRQNDWLRGINGPFHIIVSNPPYVPGNDPHFDTPELQHEPRMALDGGADGLAAIRIILEQASSCLLPGGWLVTEHGYDQSLAVQRLFRQQGFIHIDTGRDYAGLDRYTLGQIPA